MQISILNGIYSSGSDFRTSYPVNLIPVPKTTGISAGYLRPAEGIKLFFSGFFSGSVVRGGIEWKGVPYYVIGRRLVKIDTSKVDDGFSSVKFIANVLDDKKPVSFAYSFDRLAIASGGRLYYLKDDFLIEVTDPDLGQVYDVKFLDGYFLTTDGEFIVQTELNDPTAINPFKYGAAEVDPDPIVSLVINRGEMYAVNRYSIEVFTNTGGEFFAFSRIKGAHIQRGAVGRDACCVYNEALAFVGSARNEPPAVYLGENAQTIKLSTREIDQLLYNYTADELATVVTETRTIHAHKFLYVHLPDRTLVYDSAASIVMQEPVWHVLTSTIDGFRQYKARFFVYCDGRWFCGNPGTEQLCYLTEDPQHISQDVRTEFATSITITETGGAVVHAMELQTLNPSKNGKQRMSASYTTDGETWSVDRWATEYQRRLVWPQQGLMHGWRAYRFRGNSAAKLSFSRLDAKAEPLIL
jgi:Phage stabilisation protein